MASTHLTATLLGLFDETHWLIKKLTPKNLHVTLPILLQGQLLVRTGCERVSAKREKVKQEKAPHLRLRRQLLTSTILQVSHE